MRKQFFHYYRPTDEEFKKLWDECVFTFDANVLLDLYKLKTESAKNILNVIEELKDRIWLSNQVAYEYYKNRLNVISTHARVFKSVEEDIKTALNKHKGDERLLGVLKTIRENSQRFLKIEEDNQPDFISSDFVLNTITEYFDGKVGPPYEEDRQVEIEAEANQRYQRRVPPGHEDTDKGGSEQYGDVVLWFQLIDYSREQEKPIVFITQEKKEDWWFISGGRTVMPRPELRQEMLNKTGQQFYMYPAKLIIRKTPDSHQGSS